MAGHNQTGQQGEDLACDFLQDKGYEILERNWRYQRAEIDIIARDGKQLVVLEVKSRSQEKVQPAEAAVDKRKQRLLIKAANAYLVEKNLDLECRFDILSVLFSGETIHFRHLEDAFYPLLD
jgi:putative endonuclease